MGQHDVKELEPESLRSFTRHLLADLRALELMLRHGSFETGVRRIGSEQELFLLDKQFRPAPLAMEMLEKLGDEHFTTEVARFNLEFNSDPLVFGGACLRRMEDQLSVLFAKAKGGCAARTGSSTSRARTS
jgi:hypothetical protein